MNAEELARQLADVPDDELRNRKCALNGEIDLLGAQIYTLRKGVDMRKWLVSEIEAILTARGQTRRADIPEPAEPQAAA